MPITAIVYILSLPPLFNLNATERITFSVGAVLLVLGVGISSVLGDNRIKRGAGYENQ